MGIVSLTEDPTKILVFGGLETKGAYYKKVKQRTKN